MGLPLKSGPLLASLAILSSLKALSIVSSGLQLYFLSNIHRTTLEAVRENDIRQGIIAIITLAAFLVVIVTYLIWLYKAKSRAVELGASGFELSPDMSVGCHFIPIVNFFLPYRAVSELFQSALNAGDWRNQKRSHLVPIWWGLWILDGLWGFVVYYLAKNGAGLQDLVTLTYTMIVSSAVSLICLLLMLKVVRQISDGIDGQEMIRAQISA
jgi:hypothetical protein